MSHSNELSARTLSDDELDSISAGMKWDRNYRSPEVIDARGGYVVWLGWVATFDVNGKTSSIQHV